MTKSSGSPKTLSFPPATHENCLNFGSSAVGETRQITFTLTNHSSHPVKFQWPNSLPGFSFSPASGHLHPSSSKDVSVSFKAGKPVILKRERVAGKLWKIRFLKPLNEVSFAVYYFALLCIIIDLICEKLCRFYKLQFVQVTDWDNRLKTVRWVNVPTSATSSGGMPGEKPPAKKKVDILSSVIQYTHMYTYIPVRSSPFLPLFSVHHHQVVETEAEPSHSTMDDSRRELELVVWATADYAKYNCPSQEINFTDTMMYQSRVHTFPVCNTGNIALSYRWSLVHVDGSPFTPHSSQLHLEEETGSVVSEGGEVMPFSITPRAGQILPEKEAGFTVRFSPLDVREWECKLVCRYYHMYVV